MINQQTFENLILTNTIVAAFCIVLMVSFTVFIILFLIPLIRRRWINKDENTQSDNADLSTLTRQPSFQQCTLGRSRFNPLFETSIGTATTQFGALFHPQATTATLLHPTIWAPLTPTPIVASPIPPQTISTPSLTKTLTGIPGTATGLPPPPPPSQPPAIATTTATQKSNKKR